MVIKKIINLCKKEGRADILHGADSEWLGNGVGYYPMIDMPSFDEITFCSTFDIPPKAADKINFTFNVEIPAGYDFSDCPDDEVECNYCEDISIQYGGRILMPVMTSDGISFIDKSYLAPVMDGDTDLIKIYEIQSKDGILYFAVKNGLMVVAVVMPYNAAINEKFSKTLSNIAELTKIKFENMNAWK